MSLAKITLYGMFKYMQDHNDDLFDNLDLPTGMDAGKLVGRILYKGAEFGMIYGDPYFVQNMVGIWSDTYYHTFERWVKALDIDYDPLRNYDRTEEWQDAATDSRSGSQSKSSTQARNGETSRTGTDSSTDSDVRAKNTESNETGNTGTDTSVRSATNGAEKSTTDNSVSAYDSSVYQPADRSTVSGSKADTASTDTSTSGSSSVKTKADEAERTEHSRSGSSTGTDRTAEALRAEETGTSEESCDRKSAHTGHLYGNIGVMTSQQMLKEEWEVAKLNIYDEAADLFLQEFCIYVY